MPSAATGETGTHTAERKGRYASPSTRRMCVSMWGECACVPVCVSGGRRGWIGAVLAASLGTYKPCGRICLRCQLKEFSNIHPTPSPRMRGKPEDSGNPTQPPPSNQPPAQHRGTAGVGATLFPGPASLLEGPKLKEKGSSCFASPSLGGRPRTLSPPGHFTTATETATKWGSPTGGNSRGLSPCPSRARAYIKGPGRTA